MTNTTSTTSIFTSAIRSAEATRELNRKNNTFTTVLDVKDSFRLLINEANNKLKFVMYKKQNHDAIVTAEQQLEVMKAEYELAYEAEGSEHMLPVASAIYKLEKRIQGLMNTEMEIGVWIDAKKNQFTKEELETIASTIANANPYGEPVLFGKYGVLYNLGLPMVITENKVKKISSKEAVCDIQCSAEFSAYQEKQLDQKPIAKSEARSYVEALGYNENEKQFEDEDVESLDSLAEAENDEE